ncbi:MAG: hypothetical protein CVV27_20105 [Candidatus Melainabacteria bacterium HGW-Melainabacteria-1]|nr:MAG: hypothetical protein CVV27_20105 [Candidatus Melainabacteria bacterium HGW-Melainabacteria-1]
MAMRPAVLLIATFDTKAEEALYLKKLIEDEGLPVLAMDTGIRSPSVSAGIDIGQASVAAAAGRRIEELQNSKDKGFCIATMIEGAAAMAKRLYDEGRLAGVIGIGGAQGTDIGTAAMRALPFGVPKLMVSTVTSGRATFGPYVGTKDLMLMHSVADIQGLNVITTKVFHNAAAALCGMVRASAQPMPIRAKRGSVALSMLGTTTIGSMRAKELMEEAGYELVAFHQNGTGGIAMEDMIAEGLFDGVLDLNLHEIGDSVYGGLHGSIRDYRLERAGALGIPQVVAPGSINYTVLGPLESLKPEERKRKLIVHNPNLTLVRLNNEEMVETARITARKLNAAKGPLHVFIPLQGFSYPDREGLPHWDPEGNALFIETLRKELNPAIPYYELDAHINDREFIDRAVGEMINMLETRR